MIAKDTNHLVTSAELLFSMNWKVTISGKVQFGSVLDLVCGGAELLVPRVGHFQQHFQKGRAMHIV
eukprot:7534397-Ditylum_brightwellii.AAC.1